MFVSYCDHIVPNALCSVYYCYYYYCKNLCQNQNQTFIRCYNHVGYRLQYLASRYIIQPTEPFCVAQSSRQWPGSGT